MSSEYTVKPVKVVNSAGFHQVDETWPTDGRVYGWYPGIFGPGWYRGDFPSLQCPALDHLETRMKDPLDKLYDSAEEAMKAWENGAPVTMSAAKGGQYYLRHENIVRINELGVYRHYEKPMIEEDPDPGLWNLDETEEVDF